MTYSEDTYLSKCDRPFLFESHNAQGKTLYLVVNLDLATLETIFWCRKLACNVCRAISGRDSLLTSVHGPVAGGGEAVLHGIELFNDTIGEWFNELTDNSTEDQRHDREMDVDENFERTPVGEFFAQNVAVDLYDSDKVDPRDCEVSVVFDSFGIMFRLKPVSDTVSDLFQTPALSYGSLAEVYREITGNDPPASKYQ